MEHVIIKVVRQFIPFLGDFRRIKHQRLQTLLISGICVHLFILFLVALSGVFAHESVSHVAELMQGITYFNCINNHIILWKSRELILELADEVTELMRHPEVELDPEIHNKIMTECEARHLVIERCTIWAELFVSWAYICSPIMTFLKDDSPDKRLRTPLGSRDPFPMADFLGHGYWLRIILYPIYSISAVLNIVVVFHGLLVLVLLFDSLNTLFQLSGLSFRHLSHPDSSGANHLAACIRFHQRLFRVYSKIKIVTEPVLAVHVLGSAVYNVFTILLAFQNFSLEIFFKYSCGSALVLSSLLLLFIWPSLTAHMAAEIASQVYRNKMWMKRRNIDANPTDFLLVIMRAHKQVKFRVLSCFVMSQENFLKYLQNVYGLFVILRSITSISHKGIVTSS